MLCKEGNVLLGRTCGGEAGGGLDVVGVGLGNDLAHLDLLLLGEEACLDDYLKNLALACRLDCVDLGEDLIVSLVLEVADVDNHVDLVCAVCNSVSGLENLNGCGGISVGEADYRADGKLFTYVVLCSLNEGGRDAYGCGLKLHAIVTDSLDFLPGRALEKEGVVAL